MAQFDRFAHRAISASQRSQKKVAAKKAEVKAQVDAANAAEQSRYPEAEEGAWCRTCSTKYTGSVSEHFTTH